jgi:hypothetical protein
MLTDNFPELIFNAVKDLPADKQREVYDFAAFLKGQKVIDIGDEHSFDGLIGVLKGPANLSAKHDEIYE